MLKGEEWNSYARRHYRCVSARGKASLYKCECGKDAQEWATKTDTNGGLPDDYVAMCCSCHQRYDNHWSLENRGKVSVSLKAYRAAHPESSAATEESRAKMRAAHVGRVVSEEAKANMRAGQQRRRAEGR